MEYLYCGNENFEDFASGRVLYGGKGMPNFPVRLLNEMYGRAVNYLHNKEDLVVYEGLLKHEICTDIFQADCTEELPRLLPDIIITDVPYGNLVEWKNGGQISVNSMLEQLWLISHEKTVLVVCMDKKQKNNCEKWKRLEKHNIGKRKFEILTKYLS